MESAILNSTEIVVKINFLKTNNTWNENREVTKGYQEG